MAKYIPLNSVLAEIEKIIDDENESIKSFEHGKNVSEVLRRNARIGVLTHLRSLLDTLEVVKEVDLEKEIEEHAIYMPMSEFTHESEVEDFHEWAREEFRYFFELGIKAQKGE